MSEEAQPTGRHAAPAPSPPPAAAPAPAAACATQSDASTAISHTSIQMTTSSAPPASDTNKWSCEVCTYENFPLSRKCTMCRSPRPAVCEDIFRLQDGASALPAPPAPAAPAAPPATDNTAPGPTDIGADSVTERLRPLRISSPQGAASASSINKWSCPTCTYENWPKSLKCAMCGTPCPQPQSNGSERESEWSAAAGGGGGGGGAGVGGGGGGGAGAEEQRRASRRAADLLWLQACLGVVEGVARPVDAYLAAGGDPARALTPHEVALLNRASAFDAGHTLVHLAIRFQRQDILSALLARIQGGGPGLKRSPSYIAPDLAAATRRHVASCVRQRKGSFPAHYLNEFCTFSLPAEIEELPAAIQEQVFAELLDREAQRTLEAEPPRINWSLELTVRLGSRLYALWNRSAGDCLPDAVCQAAYGVFDRSNALRHALADTLADRSCARAFYDRWQAWERGDAVAGGGAGLHYSVGEAALRAEWARQVGAAGVAGAPLSQLHVFALAHVLRRPLIVYGVQLVHSFRGEALGYARFQGIYLPLLWEPEFCSKSPLCLGYTRGHFSALVPMEPYSHRHTYICREQQEEAADVTFLPLTDADGKLLPVHFLTCDEMGSAEALVRRWLAVCVTRGGLLAARQTLHQRPLLVAQMLEEWLNHYRRLAQQTRGPFPPRLAQHELSSDPDTDIE